MDMALVRVLPDGAFQMSVVDQNGQYSMVPSNNTVGATAVPLAAYVPVTPVHNVGTEPCADCRTHGVHNHGAQAVDGRYASVYQMVHCNVLPTSPPVEVTEFPPQRAELSRGQGNFEVGGIGSGETSTSPTRMSQSYRGGMNWPDKSVYTARTPAYHYERDSFAESLRKYPNLSPERSAEVFERLVNYTQMRASNLKPINRGSMSPTRSEAGPGVDRRGCTSSCLRTSKAYDSEVGCRPKIPDESPTRDTCRKIDESFELKRALYAKSYDLRCFRDITRRAKESVRSVSTYPYSHTVCPPIKERYDHLPPRNNFLAEILSVNSVHMETQAEIPTASKEVTTVPRERPISRNVAVPLSPTSSQSNSAKLSDPNKVSEFSTHIQQPELEAKLSHKSIQTVDLTDLSIKPRKSVQTCISSIDIANKKKVKTCRKTKSEEEIRLGDDLEEELVQVIKDLSVNSDLGSNFCVRNGLLKKLRKVYKTERSDRVKIKLGRCLRDQLYSQIDLKHFTKELSNELMSKIEASDMIHKYYESAKVLEADTAPARKASDKCVNDLVKECLNNIPVKKVDYLGRPVKRELVLHAVTSKIKCLIMNKHYERSGSSLKLELLNALEDFPVEINSRNKNHFLNKLASELVKKIKDVFSINAPDRKRWQKAIDLDKTLKNNLKTESFAYTRILPTDNEMKAFVKQEFRDFTKKFHVTVCPSTEKNIQIELIDLLIDSLNALKYGEDEKVKEEILVMLSDFIAISENEGIYFVNNLIYNFKDMLKDLHTEDALTQTFVVVNNSVQNSSNQTIEHTNEVIKDQDIDSNLNAYTQQIVEQINEWMENIQALSEVDAGVKKAVAQDLARDIVDRHKYFELNPNNKKSDDDELEHLKYQIFKWTNKLVGEDNSEMIGNASQLMQRIQNVSVLMLAKPITVQNVFTSGPIFFKSCGRNPNTQRRCSSPGEICCLKPATNCEKKRQSCPHYTPYEAIRNEQNRCCVAEVDTENLGVMTDARQVRIAPTKLPPFPIRTTTYTETDMPQILATRPRGTSTHMTDCYRVERSTSRKCCGTPEHITVQPSDHKPATLICHIEQQTTSRPRSPDRPKPLCCTVDPKAQTSTAKELNEEYDLYLQNWISQIPIITSKPEEQALIDTMRKGIYNGVWKARAKVQMNPNALDNRFYYQDLFDDELEELLHLLPQSSELTKNKQMLKNQLIEKTVNMNEQMHNSSAPTTYKQQLIDNVGSHIPRKVVGFAGSDIAKICEDIHKLNLAETYIMYTLYRFKDNVKANVYKKKLMKQVQEFFDNLKRTQGIEAKDMDFKTYKDEIMNGLHTVPQPSDDTIREEGNEVLIGLEIEQWFSDLPLYPSDNNFEILCRKRYRDTLAKKVHDMEKEKNLCDCEDELRHEITRFMGKLPLREGELQNMPFMVEELVNRLKNRPKDLIEGSEKRRLMPLIDPYDYDEFSRDMPLCSSFSDAPDARRPQINESSYLIRGGERAEDKYSPLTGDLNYVHHRGDNSDSNQQWQSCYKDGATQARPVSKGLNSNQRWQSQYDTDNGAPPARQISQSPNCCQQRQSLHDDEVPQTRPSFEGPSPSQPWQSLHETGASPAMEMSCQSPNSNRQRQNWHDTDDEGPPARQMSQSPNCCPHGQSLHDGDVPQIRQSFQGPNSSQPWQSLHDDGAPPARQISQNPCCQHRESLNDDGAPPARQMSYQCPNSNQQWQTLHDSANGTRPAREMVQSSDSNQKRHSLNEDGTTLNRQTSQGQNSNRQWQCLPDDEAPPASPTEKGLRSSSQYPPDCCRLEDGQDGHVESQAKPRDYSHRELERRRQGTIRPEQTPYTSRLQETDFSGTCMGQAASPDRNGLPSWPPPALHSNRYTSRPQITHYPGSCAEQAKSTDSRSPGRAPEQPSYTSRLQETYHSASPATSPDERLPQELSPYTSRMKETRISGSCAEQARSPDRRSPEPTFENFSRCSNRCHFRDLPTSGFSGNDHPKTQKSQRGSLDDSPDRSPVPYSGPVSSTRPYDGHPGSSQEPFSQRQSPSYFSGQPVGTSTPQQYIPPPRESRPKKRTRQVQKPKRDAARKRLEMSESEESGSEEVKCRCMERIWRCKKRRPIYSPCEEYDVDFPPCFPLRFPYSYYF